MEDLETVVSVMEQVKHRLSLPRVEVRQVRGVRVVALEVDQALKVLGDEAENEVLARENVRLLTRVATNKVMPTHAGARKQGQTWLRLKGAPLISRNTSKNRSQRALRPKVWIASIKLRKKTSGTCAISGALSRTISAMVSATLRFSIPTCSEKMVIIGKNLRCAAGLLLHRPRMKSKHT